MNDDWMIEPSATADANTCYWRPNPALRAKNEFARNEILPIIVCRPKYRA